MEPRSTLEKRRYGEGSTPEEEQAVRDQIYVREDHIVVWVEVPVPSRYVMSLFREEIERKAPPGPVDLLIDLRSAGRPDADARDGIRELFLSIENLGAVAAFTGRNSLLNSAARFVLRRSCPEVCSVHKKKEEALDAIRAARARRRAVS